MTIGIDGHDLEGKRTGVGRYLFNILQAWERSGALTKHSILLFFKDEIPADLPRNIGKHLLPPLTLRLRSGQAGRSSNALFMHVALPRAANTESIDVLFCPGYVAPLRWKGPLVLTLHDIIYEARPGLFRFQSPADYILLKYASKRSAGNATRILVPSQFSASEVEKYYGIPKERIVVTPEAADDIFQPMLDEDAARRIAASYGITGPYLFFVGSIFSRRHVPECIEAFTRLARDFPDHQFLVAGANYTHPFIDIDKRIEGRNKTLGRTALLHVPFIEAAYLPALYSAAEVTVWLSEYEGFGLPPLESLACGTPVITTKLTALPETVGDCAAFVHDPSDIDEIETAMYVLLSDTAARERLASCGPQHAARFSWETCAKQTLVALLESANNAPENLTKQTY